MAAFTTLANGKASASGGGTYAGTPTFGVIEGEFDATQRNLAQNDTIDIAAIPAGTWVLGCAWTVKTVEGAARNFSVGNSSSATAFVASTTANTLASGGTAALTEGTPNTLAGYYGAADKLRVAAVTSGGLVATKIKVRLFCMFNDN